MHGLLGVQDRPCVYPLPHRMWCVFVFIDESFLSGEAALLSEAPHSRGDPDRMTGTPKSYVFLPLSGIQLCFDLGLGTLQPVLVTSGSEVGRWLRKGCTSRSFLSSRWGGARSRTAFLQEVTDAL